MMNRTAVAAALAGRPRAALAAVPTPLQDAPRLRDALGGARRCPRIFVKRDDLTGLAGGGNKARKLDYLVGDAQAAGATTLITTGAVQSNHARMTAGAARLAGMEAELVLTAHADLADEGNLLLDRLFGARVHFVPAVDPALAVGLDEETVQQVAAAVRDRGGTPYVIPVGGSSAVGALGYVAGTLELCTQLDALGVAPTRLYFASGSRGTQAGLTLGAHLCGASYQLHGIAVSGGEPEKFQRARRVAGEAAALLGADGSVLDRPFVTDQGFIGEGYGLPSAAGLEAMLLAARTEALVLDGTYTAKAMAALIRHVRDGAIDPETSVVFLHTGGSPAVFTRAATAALRQLPEWQVL
jgi:1-aminocyclopropane-1-carboxylate deaminase/D-cysteine desulfhydrase-like pyridoxal-dependent ACC family enzyme